jgi:hypothetical protein
VAALVAACGGGGDDGAVNPQPPPTPTYVTISAANQDTVARASFTSAMAFVSVPILPASPSPGLAKAAQAGGATPLAGHGGLTQLALRVVKSGSRPTAVAPTGMARPLAQQQLTEPCLVSGTMTVTWDDRDNSRTLTAGDTVSALFNQCDDDTGFTVNGGMAMAIATYSETDTVLDTTGSATFQSLSMVGGWEAYKLDGGAAFRFNVTLTADGIDMLSSFTIASGGLTVVKQGGTAGFSDTFSYRAGYTVNDRDFSPAVQGGSYWEEITANGDFGSQALGGDLTLKTITPFKSVFTDPTGDIFPSQGQLLVTGGEGTKLRLTATPTVQVQMEVSYDSDDEWEYSGVRTWDWFFQ